MEVEDLTRMLDEAVEAPDDATRCERVADALRKAVGEGNCFLDPDILQPVEGHYGRRLIHTDPATAQRYGYRAPIIAGNQTVNFVLEALSLDARPHSFAIEVRFRKPVFWDESVTIEGRRDASGRPLRPAPSRRVGPQDNATANNIR